MPSFQVKYDVPANAFLCPYSCTCLLEKREEGQEGKRGKGKIPSTDFFCSDNFLQITKTQLIAVRECGHKKSPAAIAIALGYCMDNDNTWSKKCCLRYLSLQ